MLKRLLFAVLLAISFACQAAVYSLPWGPKPQFVDANGAPMSGGTLQTFAGSSTTPQVTYTDSTGGVANPTTITLNVRGESPNEVWLTGGQTYKFVLKDSSGVTVWTVDSITGVNDVAGAFDEWKAGPAPTFVSATSFTLVGDQTVAFHVGRRIKTTNSGGTVYSTIKSSTFGASTTVTVTNDSGTLDSGLSAVSYALLSKNNDSLPRGVFPTIGNVGKVISGYTYANNGTDSIDVAAGQAGDSTGVYWITGSALTKNITAAWAVGSAAGCLDTGAVGNSDYYVWAIARPDTGVADYLCSLSSTAPTMPASYSFKRLIGWFKRVGGSNVAFHTYEIEGGGLEMNWDVPTLDVNLANTLTTARRTDAVKVPLTFSTTAHLNVHTDDAGSVYNAWIYCPDQTDAAPADGSAPLSSFFGPTGNSAREMFVRTSATGTIAARADLATVDNYRVSTMGFRWARR